MMGNSSEMSYYNSYELPYVNLDNDIAWPSDDPYPETTARQILYLYVSPLLLFLGTIGNIISFIIMHKLSSKVMSSCIYLAVIAVMDTLILFVRCGDDWLQEFDKIEINNRLLVYSDSTCKVYPFVFNFIFHLDRWLLVSMAIEGLISVKYPHKMEKFCSMDRARAIILLLTVLLVTVNLHYFWSFHLEKLTEMAGLPGRKCDFPTYGNQHSEEFQEVIWPTLEILVAEILPRTIVFICALLMAVKIARGDHIGSKRHQEWQAKFTLDPRAIAQMKVLIMIVCFTYVFLTLPKFGYLIFKYLEENQVIDMVADSEFEPSYLKDALIHAIVSNVDYFFLSMKFFLYVAVSQRFRYEFLCLFHCITRCRKLSFQYQKPRSSFTQPLMKDSSTNNSSFATTFEHLPKPVLSEDGSIQTSIITTV